MRGSASTMLPSTSVSVCSRSFRRESAAIGASFSPSEVLPVSGTGESLILSGTKALEDGSEAGGLTQSGSDANSLEPRLRELENELRRVERERDVLKRALAIFGRRE